MIHKKVDIKVGKEGRARLETYFLDNFPEVDRTRIRPVVLLCPGGAYEFTSDREAEAVAVQFMARGFHACILRYSVAPAIYPQALLELTAAVSYLRQNHREYFLDPNKIIVAGFSAGGHLAATLGVYWQEKWLEELTGEDRDQYRPNALLLCYPVITSGEYTHVGSMRNLMGKAPSKELKEKLSLEKHVTFAVPPVFMWHTWDDDCVPVENSLLFANALRKAGVSLELHLFPHGCHGLSLANEETKNTNNGLGVEKNCQIWMELAGAWMKEI
ncbi:MAG: alpha/beta hydrolase [Acetivibrio sp.]